MVLDSLGFLLVPDSQGPCWPRNIGVPFSRGSLLVPDSKGFLLFLDSRGSFDSRILGTPCRSWILGARTTCSSRILGAPYWSRIIGAPCWSRIQKARRAGTLEIPDVGTRLIPPSPLAKLVMSGMCLIQFRLNRRQ